MNSPAQLDLTPPYLWPEPRWHAQQGAYPEHPPFRSILCKAGLVAGVITGLADGALDYLAEIIRQPGKRRVRLVFAVYPAGPTRAEHLVAANLIAAQCAGSESDVQFRVLPVERIFGTDFELPSLPPTLLYAQTEGDAPLLCIGSIGDGGCGAPALWSFNAVFQPDDVMRDAWRRWFGFIFETAAPLTPATAQIPHLVPPRGTVEAAELWKEFTARCSDGRAEGAPRQPEVNPATGEVTPMPSAEDMFPKPWDEDANKLDPLACEFARIYGSGKLVTVDESTRLKPLSISVKAAVFGEESEKSVGDVRREQRFVLQILDEATTKEVEKCRKIGDVVRLLSLPLSQGVRWIPDPAIKLLDREIAERNKRGAALLAKAVGGDVDNFIKQREQGIRNDLNAMYRDELKRGDCVPEDRMQAILEDVRARLLTAVKSSVAPSPVYNPVSAPNLTASTGAEAWAQPLSLALHAARTERESITDPFFPRNFKSLKFTQEEFEIAMNAFGDHLVGKSDSRKASQELTALTEIEAAQIPPLEKCRKVVALIRGNGDNPS